MVIDKLQNAVEELQEKFLTRQRSIKENLQALETKIQALQEVIDSNRQMLVEAELSGDVSTVEKVKAKIGELKEDQNELKEQQEAYEQVRSRGDYAADLKKIRELAKQALQEKSKNIKQAGEELRTIQEDLERLTNQKNELENKLSWMIRVDTVENVLERIEEMIDPRSRMLDSIKKRKFWQHFLEGKSFNELFPQPEPLGPNV